MASPYTGLGPTDFVAIFMTLFSDIQTTRANRGLSPLVSAHLGQEQLSQEESPPRIVVVPTHNEYAPAKRIGTQPMTGGVTAFNPRPFYVRRCYFEAHLWGDESPSPSTPPTEQDLWYSFNSAIELERELFGALMRNAGNNPALRFRESRWSQPTNMQRLGRLLVLPFSFETPVTDEPWVTVAPTTINVDVEASFPDGTNVDQGTIVIPGT